MMPQTMAPSLTGSLSRPAENSPSEELHTVEVKTAWRTHGAVAQCLRWDSFSGGIAKPVPDFPRNPTCGALKLSFVVRYVPKLTTVCLISAI